jgi:homoserine dehydrogenase
MRANRLRVGVAGLGTVGGGLLKLFAAPGAALAQSFDIVAVSARNRDRDRDFDIAAFRWFDDPVELARSGEIDVFVELIGGAEGPARDAVEAALARGVHVVTANKALIALYGASLAPLAERTGAKLLFEASVGGGVPMIKAIKESLAGCRTQAIAGILNGTSNFILSEMEDSGRSFTEVLAEAQRLGYAEADPSMDVGGADAAHKLAILAAIAFGAQPDFAHVQVDGIEAITLTDIRMAGKLGYRIKLVARAAATADGLAMRVRPTLLPLDHPLASVNGSLNALVVDAEPVGRLSFVGRGAGAGPTAASVASDLMDLANGGGGAPFGRAFAALLPAAAATPPDHGQYYLRFLVSDRPGVVAAVSDRLAREQISIESFLQAPPASAVVPIVLTTQTCLREALNRAVAAIAALEFELEPPLVLAIERQPRGAGG